MEIGTVVHYSAQPISIISNNIAWNIERLDQEMNYGGHLVGTKLRNLGLCRRGSHRTRRARLCA